MMLKLLAHFLLIGICLADRVDYGHIPNGENPTLYDPKDSILQLDEDTFSDTVYNASTAFGVEFYADWCGHCRAFATEFKEFAQQVKEWWPVVKIAAVNCADPYNEQTCIDNRIRGYPSLKYFPRTSSGVEAATTWNSQYLLSALVERINNESALNRYPDWPNLAMIGNESSISELWLGAPESSKFLAVIFGEERMQQNIIKMILDLSKYHNLMVVRRSGLNTTLAKINQVTEPKVMAFRRDSNALIFISNYDASIYEKLENLATTGSPGISLSTTSTTLQTTTTTIPSWSCRFNRENSSGYILAENSSECATFGGISGATGCSTEYEACLTYGIEGKCRDLYYVSETDMLKAIRYALYNDVPRSGGVFIGSNLTALKTFVDLLADHFPTKAVRYERLNNGVLTTELKLNYSSKARDFFIELKRYLANVTANNGSIAAAKWQRNYAITERQLGISTFATTAKWQHCRGSTQNLRGYTCGLWTTFHALTVQAYLDNQENATFQPLQVLQAIRSWIDHFFGCRHCRDHFMNMTTQMYRMDTEVKKPTDVMLYLWKAHNIVNDRLKGDKMTEDIEFPKYQFPAAFLCENCAKGNDIFDDTRVTEFLVEYYSSIRPHDSLSPEDLEASSTPPTAASYTKLTTTVASDTTTSTSVTPGDLKLPSTLPSETKLPATVPDHPTKSVNSAVPSDSSPTEPNKPAPSASVRREMSVALSIVSYFFIAFRVCSSAGFIFRS